MGIKERQERDREAVRRSILDAARELFVSEGYRHVSIRKIAERIEYSPAAIYGYFPAKDDIFFALAEEGFRLLHGEREDEEALRQLSPLDRIRAIFAGLYRFSVNQPEYFSLMFIDREVPRISREYERFAFAQEIKAQLLEHVRECIDAGVLPPTTRPGVVFRLLTTSLLGVAVMRLGDRLAAGENADDLAHDVVNIVIAGLQTGLTLRSHHHPDPCRLEEMPAASRQSPVSKESLS